MQRPERQLLAASGRLLSFMTGCYQPETAFFWPLLPKDLPSVFIANAALWDDVCHGIPGIERGHADPLLPRLYPLETHRFQVQPELEFAAEDFLSQLIGDFCETICVR